MLRGSIVKSKAGHLGFAVLQFSSKSYFQVNLKIQNKAISGSDLLKQPTLNQIQKNRKAKKHILLYKNFK